LRQPGPARPSEQSAHPRPPTCPHSPQCFWSCLPLGPAQYLHRPVREAWTLQAQFPLRLSFRRTIIHLPGGPAPPYPRPFPLCCETRRPRYSLISRPGPFRRNAPLRRRLCSITSPVLLW